MCLRFVLTPLVYYLRRRLTSCRGRLTTFTCGGSVLSSADAPPCMMSKASLGVPSRLKNGATVSSLIARSMFTTHSKRFRVGDVSQAHPSLAKLIITETVRHFSKLNFISWTPVLAEKS